MAHLLTNRFGYKYNSFLLSLVTWPGIAYPLSVISQFL